MLVPFAVSYFSGEPEWLSFLYAVGVSVAVGLGLLVPFPRQPRGLTRREAFACVTFGWVSASVLGAIPFWLSGIFSPVDALFETISGFTTTGSSVLSRIDDLPSGILLWRSLTQWLGGMGIILLSIAILPLLGAGGTQLYRAEVPGPFVDKIKPRMSETAKILWKTYFLITALEVALLWFGDMTLFDAICHAFATMATGGFSTKLDSVGHYGQYHRVVITLFMFLAGANFALHYRFMKGHYGDYWQDREFRFYVSVVAVSTTVVFVTLLMSQGGAWPARLQDAAFHVVSILTTTGFATTDYEKWHPLCRFLLLLLMFVGGCAGSTGGGIKCVRLMLVYKFMKAELHRLIHPQAVVGIKVGKQPISPAVISNVLGMTFLYLAVFLVASVIMTLLGLDLITAISSVAATLGNIGPGLGAVGPTGNFGDVPTAGKCVLMFCMLAGRLEIYTVFILLFPEFWRK